MTQNIQRILMTAGAVCILIMLGNGLIAFGEFQKLTELSQIIYKDYAAPLQELGLAHGNLVDLEVLRHDAQSNPKVAAGNRERARKELESVRAALTAYGATVLRTTKSGRSERGDLDALNRAMDPYVESTQPFYELLLRNAPPEQVQAAAGAVEQRFLEVRAAYDRMLRTAGEVAEEVNAQIEADARAGVRLHLIGWGGCLLSMGLIAAFAARLISKKLTTNLQILSESTAQLRATAQHVSEASQSLARGASDQAASLEETSASLEEISSMTRKNAEGSAQAKELAQGAAHSAEIGGSAMSDLAQAMQQIATSSSEIEKIIKVIDEIAFQTNILALNAAVEAARAGEAGMGFAVVADEVRNLAQRSAQAAKDTARLIEESGRRTASGVELTERVESSLREIQRHVQSVDGLVGQIAAASHEQAQGIEQTNAAVAQMDRVTQQNAAAAEESAAATDELSGQAAALEEVLESLQQLVGGGAEGGRPVAREVRRAVPRPSNDTSLESQPRVRGGRRRPPPLRSTGTDDVATMLPLPTDDSFEDFS